EVIVVATTDCIMLQGHTFLPRACPWSVRGCPCPRHRQPRIHESGPLEGGRPESETGLTPSSGPLRDLSPSGPAEAACVSDAQGASSVSDGAERHDGVVAAEAE